MHNDLLSIGPLTIHGYGLMIAIGILAAYLTAEKRGKARGLDADIIFNLTICAVVGGIAGAKLLFYIVDIKNIIADPSRMLDLSNGFVVYGGIILGIIVAMVYCRKKQAPFLKYADIILPSVALAQGFGRIGCFLAGCCYGIETDSALSVVFTNSSFAPNGIHLAPTQLYSSGLDFLNCLVLVFISHKTKKDGVVSWCYLLFYSVGRFCIEFLRGDIQRGSIGILSTSQFISIWMGLIALIGLVHVSRRCQGDMLSGGRVP